MFWLGSLEDVDRIPPKNAVRLAPSVTSAGGERLAKLVTIALAAPCAPVDEIGVWTRSSFEPFLRCQATCRTPFDVRASPTSSVLLSEPSVTWVQDPGAPAAATPGQARAASPAFSSSVL